MSQSPSDIKDLERLFLEFVAERGRAYLSPRVLDSDVVNALVRKGYIFKKGFVIFIRKVEDNG